MRNSRTLLVFYAYLLSCLKPSVCTPQSCIVNRRLPAFGLGVRRTQTQDMPRAFVSGSLNNGGVCHMGRLPFINNTLTVEQMPGIVYSAQMCTRSNTTLTCAMLSQNLSHPTNSTVHLHNFPVMEPVDGATSTDKTHTRRAQCTSCARANLTKVLTRLLQAMPVKSTVRQQLSFGVPHRISTERLIAAHLHRSLCGANQTCARLVKSVGCSTCLRRGQFMPAFLNKISVPQSVMPSTDSLWNRNWVFCPHNEKQSVGPSQDPSINTGVCVGSVPKIEWLDPSKRVEACARELIAEAPSSASVNFCLMNSQTERLCLQMTSWLQRTEFFLCQAAGLCEESDFFYSPTTFNLQEQEFVFDTVQRFYTEDAGLECPTTVTIDTQKETNEAVMEQCSSVSISPLLIVVEQFRAGKRSLVLLTYHWMRVSWRLMEVFLAVTADAAATLADQASNAVQAAAEALLTEVTALMFVLGDFVEQIGTAVMELTMSKGVGSTFKEIIMALCRIVTWIFNNIWARIMCPVVQFLLEFMQMCIDVWQVLVDVLRTLFIPVDLLVNVIEFVRNTLNVIASSLNECAQLPADVCVLAPPVSANTNTRGTLPMPTRCWSSYVTFFGDNQQLSCTAADTCKLGSLSSERIMCGACPSQNNPSIQEYACDYITSICTCAVPQLRESSCLVNEDCMQADDETSCMLINDDLQISRSSILCSKCQFKSMCFHSALGDSGVCACGTRERLFQTCTPQEAQSQNSLSLMLNNLCIYSPATSSFYELEFAQTSVIACLQLDPTTASCAYVVDSNMYIVRGFSRTGRRLLSMQDATYTSLDPTCRDALESQALPNTRAACQANFDNSRATLNLLGLERQLPACSFCSLTDAIEAIRSNPLAVMRMLSSAEMLLTVVRRHGPAERAAHLFMTLHSGLSKAVQRITDTDASALVDVHEADGVRVVNVDDTVLPAPIARALETWISEMIAQNELRACNNNESACKNVSSTSIQPQHTHSRRLLFFQELVMAIEMRVRDGWDKADRLHEAFAQSITQILTYRNMDQEQTLAEQQWGKESTSTGSNCNELLDLLKIGIRITNGIRMGWLTLTHERDNLQGQPAEALKDAWPKLLEPDVENALPEYVAESSDDKLVQLATDTVNATLHAFDIRPDVFYNFLFSVASGANMSFTCPYEAVQTCSAWKVRLWQGLIIIIFYFCVIALLLNTVGLSFLSSLLIPIFSLLLLQLCYGYMWTCLPMVPVCAWQDLTESINVLLPITLELPDDLKKTDAICLEPCAYSLSARCLPRYPSAKCTKSCKETPFAYTSATSVVTWTLAEIGPWATQYALNNSHHVPFLQHERFNRELLSHILTLRRGSSDFVRAHRLCAGLSSYMLFPYILLILLALSLISTMLTLLASQIYPLLLLVFSLFTAASTGPQNTFYRTEVAEEDVQDNDTTEDNTVEIQEDIRRQHVVDMP
jgi:hypothetical protein